MIKIRYKINVAIGGAEMENFLEVPFPVCFVDLGFSIPEEKKYELRDKGFFDGITEGTSFNLIYEEGDKDTFFILRRSFNVEQSLQELNQEIIKDVAKVEKNIFEKGRKLQEFQILKEVF